jgi:ATP-binding cassette subfamily B protein/subfamily B ATP-binding cassette protein MsbA
MSACQGSVTFLIEKLFNEVFVEKNERLATIIPLGFILIFTINGFARYFHLYYMRYTADLVTVRLRQMLQQKFTRLNLSFHNQYQQGAGGLISRILNDVSTIQSGLHFIADVLREPILAVFLLFYMLIRDWKLTLFVLIIVPLLTTALRRLARSLRKYGHHSQQSLESLTTTLKESLDGVRVIQAFNLEGIMDQRFQSNIDDYLETRRKIISREEAAGPISEMLASLFFASMCIYMGQQIIHGHSNMGVFTGFLTALGFMQKPVKRLQEAFVRLQQTSVTVERIFEILDNTSIVPESKSPRSFPTGWKKICFRNISFSFGDEPILKNIDFTVERGQTIALVGESGSGKSTLVNLLARYFDPTSGSITIDDVPIQDMPLKELRDHIGLVTQDVFLFNDTIENNIHFGRPQRPLSEVPRSAELANAHGFISRLPKGYQSTVGERGSRLSGGERQRLSIARAIFKDAPLLILDEATSALDSASELEVQRGIEHLMQGRTSFIIAHRLSTIIHADLILVLKEGRIVETGTHKTLLNRQGEYFNFCSLQSFLH